MTSNEHPKKREAMESSKDGMMVARVLICAAFGIATGFVGLGVGCFRPVVECCSA